jgi:hypothetical protein
VISLVSLALDLVGAVALVLGLFGHAIRLYTGFRRPPEEAAHYAAFATAGLFFLPAGSPSSRSRTSTYG